MFKFVMVFVASATAALILIEINRYGSPVSLGDHEIAAVRTAANRLSVNPMQVIGNATLQSAVDGVIEADPRNAGVDVSVYYRDNFSKSALVFDLNKISGSKSRADVFRVFLDSAKALENEQFDQVILASKGNQKFMIDGSYFSQLGQERDWQNPTYTVRTFPQSLRTLSGERAFSVWTGGLIGVAKQQMEDFNEFHSRWYLDDLVSSTSTTSTSRGNPVATRVSAKSSSRHRVTKTGYDRLDNGISYADACNAIGMRGTEVSKGFLKGAGSVGDIETISYSWVNVDGSNAIAIFQNDRLIQKAQYGLR